jgi:hypothetical protein
MFFQLDSSGRFNILRGAGKFLPWRFSMAPEALLKRFSEIVNRRDPEALGDGLAEEGPAGPISGWTLV